MVSLTTHNIKVSAETFYQEKLSKPEVNEFLFTYRITIENNGSKTVQLLKRVWNVTNRGMHLKTEIGKMTGTYFMHQLIDNKILEIQIPEFKLVAPFKLN